MLIIRIRGMLYISRCKLVLKLVFYPPVLVQYWLLARQFILFQYSTQKSRPSNNALLYDAEIDSISRLFFQGRIVNSTHARS